MYDRQAEFRHRPVPVLITDAVSDEYRGVSFFGKADLVVSGQGLVGIRVTLDLSRCE